MTRSGLDWRTTRWRCVRLLFVLAGVLGSAAARAQSPAGEQAPPPRPVAPAATVEQLPPVLSLAEAVRFAVAHNPSLATARKQHGIAAAGIVIANTYPFNPILQDFVWGDNGPSSAGITNRVFNEHTMRLDLELRGQGRHRRAMAQAALSRTDWQIAAQEMLVAVQVVRAFNTVLYRRQKLRVQEQTTRLQEDVLKMVTRLVEQGQLPRTELILARADVADAQSALGPVRNLLVVAENDLHRLLGVVDGRAEAEGTLEATLPKLEEGELVTAAENRRPDLHALELAVKEAEARMRLEVANRYGNPSLGPAYEYNETSVNFIGMWLIWQIPILNTRRGEIQQRQAERAQAVQAAQSLAVTIQQDVRAALNRLAAAEESADVFRKQTLPSLQSTREALDKLFAQGEPGVTLARVIAVRNRLLTAYSTYLDALFELSQARADLAAAVGDPTLAFAAAPPPATVTATTPPPK